MPNFYKDKLEFDEPKTLYEAMRKAKLTYDQSKSKSEYPFNFKRKDGNGFKKREFKPFNNKHKSFQKNAFKDKQPTLRTEYKQPMRTTEYKDTTFNKKNEEIKREPLQCWGCGGSHFYRDCPHKKDNRNIHTVREAATVGEVARNIPQISAALDNHQADFQPSMIEVEGKILEKPVSILIDSGSTLSYISPKLVDLCQMRKYDFEK